MTIRCGNRAVHAETTHHESVAAVRACHRGETHPCNWLIEIPAGWVPEIEDWMEARVEECGATSWELEDGRGWTCAAGHEHISAEVRDREGWDYADGPEEARRLAKVGVASVGMDGRPIL